MKKHSPSNPQHSPILKQYTSLSHNNNLQIFLDSYIKCHSLYHMKKQSQIHPQIEESQLVRHLFVNLNKVQGQQNQQKEQYLTLFNTMNKDNSHSKEEQEYSKYLKQYQTMVKCSRKKEYTSPQKTNKQMNLLIHEFLSDMDSPSTESNKTTVEKTATPTKTNEQKVRVEKINLNNFSINKATKHEEVKVKGVKQKNGKEKTPRFINLIDKIATKPEKNVKDKQKLQIQVIKVKNITPNQQKNTPKQIIKRYQPSQTPIMLQTFNPIIQRQINQDGYSSSYLKNKQIKDNHYSIKNPQQSQKKPKPQKKPLKIQIQIPVQQLSHIQSPIALQQQKINDLDNERQKIIKQISDKVFNLLHKTNRITNTST